MKKKEYIFVGLLIALLVISTIYSYIRYQRVYEVQSFLYDLKKKSDATIEQLYTWKECRFHELSLNGKEISTDWGVVDMQGNEKRFPSVMSDNTLVLRYSEMHCDVCIDSIVSKLNVYKDSIGLDNIVLLTSSKNLSYIRKFRKINNIRFNVYKIDEAAESILLDIDMPYLFIYSSANKRVNNMFVPQKENAQLTNQYLHSILMKYYTK